MWLKYYVSKYFLQGVDKYEFFHPFVNEYYTSVLLWGLWRPSVFRLKHFQVDTSDAEFFDDHKPVDFDDVDHRRTDGTEDIGLDRIGRLALDDLVTIQ